MLNPAIQFPIEKTIRFILDGTIVCVSDIDPAKTVLQYLRENLLRCGTKEGCAEGDCGACTVVIGELERGRIRLRSVNACIQFLPMLHGKSLFTVESLTPVHSARLHPVQQAMVDYSGSQCGFCTSGFVMSLFALFKTTENPDRKQINDALSGNLCRCTGYRPIIEAAQKMYQFAGQNWLTQAANLQQIEIDPVEQQLINQLEQIRPDKTLHLEFKQLQYFAPLTVNELHQLLELFPQATLVAGNTDVGLWVNKQLRELPVIITLSGIESLKTIQQDTDFITIAAAVSITDAFNSLGKIYPELNEFFCRFASMPVRNAATLVGNIANGSPIGDSMPALMVLQAEVIISKGTEQRILALEQFYLGYQQKDLRAGEFVQAIRIPLNNLNRILASYKVSKRYDQDISAVCAAFLVELNDNSIVTHIRIAFGGMAAIPQRARTTEQCLVGLPWNLASVKMAVDKLIEDFSPLSDMRASAEYRNKLAKNLLMRFYLETQTSTAQAPVQLVDLLSEST